MENNLVFLRVIAFQCTSFIASIHSRRNAELTLDCIVSSIGRARRNSQTTLEVVRWLKGFFLSNAGELRVEQI